MVKHLAANAMTLLIVGCIVVAGIVVVGVQSFSSPGPLKDTTRITLERGVTLGPVSEVLEDAGVIENAAVFRLGAKYLGVADKIRFGDYDMPAAVSPREALDIIVSGKSVQYRITVPEGLTSWEVVEILKASDVLTGEIESIPAEGALAPDTYFVDRGSQRAAVLERMQAAQTRILREAWSLRQEDIPLKSAEEALILASIIEKETAVADERPLVGGVFTNRLRRGMRLQSDPTIIYGITQGQGPLDRPIRRSDIQGKTPYNTYVIDRLPPGPIANPGREAILAAVQPEETEALYFVADGTGGHAFAKTLPEHQRNVAAWRKIERERASE